MKTYKFCILLVSCLFFTMTSFGQTTKAGPIIKNFGKVFSVKNADYKVDASQNFHVVFDVAKSPEKKNVMNKWIETAARFLNLHAQNGIPVEKMKVAIVLHGRSVKDVLNNKAYQKKHGILNPNLALNKALLGADVQIILCGQSATYQGIKKEELIPGVKLSISAMTSLVQLQNKNYRLINF